MVQGVRQSSKTGQDAGKLEVPAYSKPNMAVFEVLDDLLESVWRRYGVQIQKTQRRDRVVKT